MQRSFPQILDHFRQESLSQRDKGRQFERLMQRYLLTEPYYATYLNRVWLWDEFPFRQEFGGIDAGIDLVAKTTTGEYWAVQCKCYQEETAIGKREVDSFLSTSGRSFRDDAGAQRHFSHRLWISTTNRWGKNAEEAIQNQTPAVSRINLHHLQNSAVEWERLVEGMQGTKARRAQKNPLRHQEEAIAACRKYFAEHDRGKLIMACGTGKTFASLKIAEQQTDGKGLVLFLVPSIALLGQTLKEWTAEAAQPLNAIAICSDAEVSRTKSRNQDVDTLGVVDLALPASTDVPTILQRFQDAQRMEGMTVVFSTYQSIEVVARAQHAYQEKFGEGEGIFDLIVCDEAHRTTGVTLAQEDESAFVKVHDDAFIRGRKRMYMTATPRIYSDDNKKRAVDMEAVLCSMDDPQIYGEEIYSLGFGDAVKEGLLSDYKVLVLTVNKHDMPQAAQEMVANGELEIPAGDVNRLIGCVNALSKELIGDDGLVRGSDPEPMRTAVAFCQNIKISKQITEAFNRMGDLYYESLSEEARARMVTVGSQHIDGTMPATMRGEKLAWLTSGQAHSKSCRILTNVRCLSEGVDVPTLDAVIFLSPRNSQVDVVQSVGRVMRRAEGKKYGYIIIPIVVPSGVDTKRALDSNREYAVVWSVLNALRAHDDRFEAMINKLELNRNKPARMAVAAASHGGDAGMGTRAQAKGAADAMLQLSLKFEQMQSLLYAKMVERVGNRRYWEQWARDVAGIAERHMERIGRMVAEGGVHAEAFAHFMEGLRESINPSVSEGEAIEMLAQHIITRPVFDALFDSYSFVQNNAISQSMQGVLDLLEEADDSEEESASLEKFYESVRMRASEIDNAEAKQKIIVELYDKFFKTAFPRLAERLGIVYTPVEVVDFILHSADVALRKEFGRRLSDANVHILDPFTGTGTFVTRLLQSGLIEPEALERKYANELHANEMVLLAYYIASVNIENVYHDLSRQAEGVYTPFDGICLTDTFQLSEFPDEEKANALGLEGVFPENAERVNAQRNTPLRVIVGNPPYSVGQRSANDNAQNQSYPKLEARIAETYGKGSQATSVKALYDAYIKAFRWASDRLDPENGGVICYVSNGAWINANGMDGFRKSLEGEFASIYVFNLRGNQRTSGELSRREGGKIFGSGSRTPIAVTLLIKKPEYTGKARIHYYEVEDYLSQREKLGLVSHFRSMGSEKIPWATIEPNAHGDWINPRSEGFAELIPMAPERKFDARAQAFFTVYSLGCNTNRDAWVYNYSREQLAQQVQETVSFFNAQSKKFLSELEENPTLTVGEFVDRDERKIAWSSSLMPKVGRVIARYEPEQIRTAQYRPFCSQHLYFGEHFVHRRGQFDLLFPLPKTENMVICVSGVGQQKPFSALISDRIPDLQLVDVTQCFPLYWYEDRREVNPTLFSGVAEPEAEIYTRREGISDFILARARNMHGAKTTREDIFHYVYGILHSPQYRAAYAADLKKMLPRLPLVESSPDFWRFVQAGRKLAELHLNYESYEKPSGVVVQFDSGATVDYEVEKMRFVKKGQRDKIRYNHQITIESIPEEAYEYVVGGRSAIEWVMERYQISTHKASSIVNNPNCWAQELRNPQYILRLLLSVMTVSLRTVEIVRGLPTLELEE